MNNFDTSSTGINLELNCFFDIDHSQHNFRENFKADPYSDDLWHFIDYGNFEAIDLDDLSNYDLKSGTIKQIKENLYILYSKFIGSKYSTSNFLQNDFKHIMNSNYSDARKSDLIEFASEGLEQMQYREFLKNTFTPLYEVIKIRGYSQGDQADIVLSNKIIEDHSFECKDKFLSLMKDQFTNQFYSAPLYCMLEINGHEYPLDQEIQDCYNYDKNEIIKASMLMFKNDNLYTSHIETITKFLSDNLPDHPEYN